MRILVVHGPNLNLFGRREPDVYGQLTLSDIDHRLENLAADLNVSLTIVQSNHEGVLIDVFHQHIDDVAGALINAGGLTHTSVALHDCIKAMPFPVIEVHMSNIHARESFRRHSMIAAACVGSVAGFGWRSYTASLRLLVETLAERN